ncbi:MAG: amidohydrolase family protein [Myxococcota bacterium]
MTLRTDIHVHVYEPAIARRALDNIRAFRKQVGITGVEIADDGTPAFLLEEMARLGLSRSVIQAVVPRPDMMGKINAWTHETVAASDGRLLAFGGIHPFAARADISDEIKRFTDSYDFRGVKLHPTLQGFPPDGLEAMRLYEAITRAGLPILIHPDRRSAESFHPKGEASGPDIHDRLSTPEHILTNEKLCRIIETFPELTIIGAHLGGSHSDRLEALVKGSPNVWLDLAIVKVFFPEGPDHVASLVRGYGAENILFGSDFPFWPQDVALAYLDKMGLSPDERRLIETENPARILAR